MLDCLEIIYLDYYNIKESLDLLCDKDIMKFLVFVLKHHNYKNISDSLKKFKDDSVSSILQLSINKNDKFFVEKNFIHITYPFNKTLDRIDILYETIGKEKWDDIFGFDFNFFKSLIKLIILRILLYNDYRISNDAIKKKMYETEFPKSTDFYFTKEELFTYYPNCELEINKILNIITKKIEDVNDIDDTYYILEYDSKFILYFIWDFLYNLYDILEKIILNNTDSRKYYKQRGKIFEKFCYRAIKSVFEEKVYTNLVYYDKKNNNHEIDCLVETENEFIIFEFKSSKFAIEETTNDAELEKYFIRAYGRGYKTINDLNSYISKVKCIKMRDNKKNIFNFNFSEKEIIFMHISLYNIDYVQTSIQKIKKNIIKPVSIYPINLNYIDFLTIFDLAKFNKELFIDYLKKRYNIINKSKMLTFDVDEIDVFGFLTNLNDEENQRIYDIIMKNCNTIDANIMIGNAFYRKQVNNYFDNKFIEEIIVKVNIKMSFLGHIFM